jgi:hypothetical protein
MRSIALLLLFSVAVFGQRGGGGGMRGGGGGIRSGGGGGRSGVGVVVTPRGGVTTNSFARFNSFGSVSGFGNVVFPGTGHAPVTTGRPGFGVGLGEFGVGRGFGNRFDNGVVVLPYPYPVGGYGYGYGDSGGYSDYGADPSAGYGYPAQPAAPTVIINQNFTSETARPVVREYTQDPSGGMRGYEPPSMNSVQPYPSGAAVGGAPQEAPTYLIAFKNHTIYATPTYWVEGDILHYISGQNMHNQVSLDLIDRDLTERLNRERNVEIRLPAAHK